MAPARLQWLCHPCCRTQARAAPPPNVNVCFHCSANPSGLMSGSHTMSVVTNGFGILPGS